MLHNLRDMKGVQGAIVVYRNMKDVIRTQFALDQGRGAFLEAPMAAYYGKGGKQIMSTNLNHFYILRTVGTQ